MANQLAAKCSYATVDEVDPSLAHPSGRRGCDYWNGGSYCDDPNSPYVDEVAEVRYCERHAGPLGWSDCKANEYTIAVKLAGHLDVPVEMLRRSAA